MAVAFVAGSAILTTTTTIPSNGTSNQTVTSAAFTPAVNDIIIVKVATFDPLTTVVSVSGGGLTWTGHGPYNAANTAPVYLYTAQAASATSMTVSVVFKCTDTYAGVAGFVVERYSGGQLAATPAIGTLTNDTTNANASITTAAANSIVAWVDSDYNGTTTTATYSSGSTQTVAPYQNSGNLSIYPAYFATTTTGTYTFGMSAPTGQVANLAGIEIQAASSAVYLSDTSRGLARGVDAVDTYQAAVSANITVSDPAAGAGRAFGGVDVPAQPVTLLDTAGPAARGVGAADAAVQPVTLLDTAGGVARVAGTADTVQGSDSLDPGASSQAFAVGQPDRVAIGVVVPDPSQGAARAVGGPALDVEVGATGGTLSNLPILRVLADFTQGPPGQPASTAGGTTVELTQAMAATSVTIRRGRQYELGKPQAGTAQITFSDPAELLNPTNASSPYNSGAASLVSYRPMRVTAVWRGTLYVLYTGYIERYPQTWEDAGFRGVKPLECVDGLAMLSNTEVHQSYFDTIAADNPSIYIPYDESSAPARVYVASPKALLSGGSSLPGNPRQGTSAFYQTQLLVGGTALRVVTSTGQGASVNYAGDTLPDGTPALALSSKAKDPTSTDTSRPTARTDTAGGSFNLNTGGSTIEFWYRWSSGSVRFLCESVTDGEFDYPTGWYTGVMTDGGSLAFVLGNSSYYSAQLGSGLFNESFYPDGQWHYAALTYSVSGGNVIVTATYDNNETNFTTGYAPQWIGINSVHAQATSDFGDPESAFNVAQFAYYPTPLTQTQRLAHYNRGVGYAGEYPSDRFTRLMNTYWGGSTNILASADGIETLDADFVYGVYPGIGVANATTPQPYTVLQAQQMVDVAAQAMTYFDKRGMATFEDRHIRVGIYAAGGVYGVFGDGPGELPYTALEYDYDPTYIYTRTQITKSQGGQVITNDNTTAQGNYGVRSYSDTIQLYNEFDLFQLGMHILARYSTQRIRIRRLEIDPAAVGSDALWQVVLGLEMSQRFTVRRRTASGLFSQDFFVEQIEHAIDPASSTWKVRLQMSPVLYAGDPGYVDVAGHSTLGVSTQVRY